MRRAREAQLGEASRPVSRFLLFAAAHNARANVERPGLLSTAGVIPADDLKFLTHGSWVDPRYATIEHVAPVVRGAGEWDVGIYERVATKHLIGNLVMLPDRENQSIGNAKWEKKRLFYRALVATTATEREEAISNAQQQGLQFGDRTLALVRSQDRLHMLDPIAAVEDWTAAFIEDRTENVLSLAWDRISPWLFA